MTKILSDDGPAKLGGVHYLSYDALLINAMCGVLNCLENSGLDVFCQTAFYSVCSAMLKISGQRLVFALFGNFFWRYIFPGQIKPHQVRKFGITAKNSLASYYFTQYVFATSS